MAKRTAYIALVCLLSLAAWRWWPRDAEYYYNRGLERLQAEDEDTSPDFDGALADFNRAIKLNPNFAAAYEQRASMMADESEARADYKRAMALEPNNPALYVSRSGFEEIRGHLDAAIADLDRAIELNPKDYNFYDRRASLKHKQGNISGTLADKERAMEVYPHDETQLKASDWAAQRPANLLRALIHRYDWAIRQDTNFAWGYYHRGVLKQLANDPDGALADLQRCSTFSDPLLNDYAAIHTWLVRSQKGEATEADVELSTHFRGRENRTPPEWEAQIARFLLGQINEEEFSAAIGGTDTERRRSQVWYYSAMKHLLAGDKTNAAESFRKARLTETRPYTVEISSQIQLSTFAQ